MPTWFLPQDFTFKPDGRLPLGMILAHPKDPTDVLVASPSSFHLPDGKTPIPLPAHDTLIEPKHVHSDEIERSVGLNLLARFAELFSGSAGVSRRRRNMIQYGEVDHEVRTFATPLADETLAAIVRIPKVRDHIESGLFGNRPVYIVSGLRVARSSFSVTKVGETEDALDLSGEGPVAGGVPGMELGGGVSAAKKTTRSDEYQTAPGIVFAYQLYAIRRRGEGAEADGSARLFTSRSAFMTGDGGDEEDGDGVMELVDATREVLEADLDEPVYYEAEGLGGDDVCVSFNKV